jgi:2-keto-4-pentenoate hydratase
VLGGPPVPVEGLDLRLLGVLLSRNGTPIDSGAGAAALGHPAACLSWLANTLAGFGERLRRGDVVLAGALTRMVPARPGDRFAAEFAHLGTVSVRFGGAA